MDIDRQREIMNHIIINGNPMTDEMLKEIVADKDFQKDIHPVMGMAINHLCNFYSIHSYSEDEEKDQTK
jgi:hypothetical protein